MTKGLAAERRRDHINIFSQRLAGTSSQGPFRMGFHAQVSALYSTIFAKILSARSLVQHAVALQRFDAFLGIAEVIGQD